MTKTMDRAWDLLMRENEELKAQKVSAVASETKRCADIADNMMLTCITDEEREIATTIRNLILAKP